MDRHSSQRQMYQAQAPCNVLARLCLRRSADSCQWVGRRSNSFDSGSAGLCGQCDAGTQAQLGFVVKELDRATSRADGPAAAKGSPLQSDLETYVAVFTMEQASLERSLAQYLSAPVVSSLASDSRATRREGPCEGGPATLAASVDDHGLCRVCDRRVLRSSLAYCRRCARLFCPPDLTMILPMSNLCCGYRFMSHHCSAGFNFGCRDCEQNDSDLAGDCADDPHNDVASKGPASCALATAGFNQRKSQQAAICSFRRWLCQDLDEGAGPQHAADSRVSLLPRPPSLVEGSLGKACNEPFGSPGELIFGEILFCSDGFGCGKGGSALHRDRIRIWQESLPRLPALVSMTVCQQCGNRVLLVHLRQCSTYPVVGCRTCVRLD
jgi:hypothetical protein